MQVNVENYKDALLSRHSERERELMDQLAQRDALIQDLLGRLEQYEGGQGQQGQQGVSEQ